MVADLVASAPQSTLPRDGEVVQRARSFEHQNVTATAGTDAGKEFGSRLPVGPQHCC